MMEIETPSGTETRNEVFTCDTPHRDTVHQVVFDYNGRRLATCSADMTVCIWDRQADGRWKRSAFWKVHGGPVWRVVWAHPEYGQVIATCSNDRLVHIWEELPDERNLGSTKWVKKTYLADSRANVTDVKFAPRHLGLMLATASAQGKVRIYEAADIMDLTRWSHVQEMDPFVCRAGCLAWSTSRLNRPLLAVGSDDPSPMLKDDQRIVVYEYHENIRRWQTVHTLKFSLALPVNDLAFSPNPAADYHQLAVAAQDVHIFNIQVPASAYCDDEGVPERGEPYAYTQHKVAVLGDLCKVWRLTWNITGNTLTGTSSDGTVRIWKAMFMNRWALLTAMSAADYTGIRSWSDYA